MKNLINNKYNIKIDKIYNKDNELYFFYENNKYYVYEHINNEVIFLSQEISKYIKINTFILNNENSYITKYKNKLITILKVNDIEDKTLKLEDIINFNKLTYKNIKKYKITKYNPKIDFKETIDKVENKIIELNKEYPLIQDSINYYIGMSENAITLLDDIYIKDDAIGIKKQLSYKNMLNPMNYILTDKQYNYSKYIKTNFYNNELDFNELSQILENNKDDENIMLFSYLMFRDDYFNIVECIIENDINNYEELIKKYIIYIKDYEKILKYCKKELKTIKKIQLIDWI